MTPLLWLVTLVAVPFLLPAAIIFVLVARGEARDRRQLVPIERAAAGVAGLVRGKLSGTARVRTMGDEPALIVEWMARDRRPTGTKWHSAETGAHELVIAMADGTQLVLPYDNRVPFGEMFRKREWTIRRASELPAPLQAAFAKNAPAEGHWDVFLYEEFLAPGDDIVVVGQLEPTTSSAIPFRVVPGRFGSVRVGRPESFDGRLDRLAARVVAWILIGLYPIALYICWRAFRSDM